MISWSTETQWSFDRIVDLRANLSELSLKVQAGPRFLASCETEAGERWGQMEQEALTSWWIQVFFQICAVAAEYIDGQTPQRCIGWILN